MVEKSWCSVLIALFIRLLLTGASTVPTSSVRLSYISVKFPLMGPCSVCGLGQPLSSLQARCETCGKGGCVRGLGISSSDTAIAFGRSKHLSLLNMFNLSPSLTGISLIDILRMCAKAPILDDTSMHIVAVPDTVARIAILRDCRRCCLFPFPTDVVTADSLASLCIAIPPFTFTGRQHSILMIMI